MSDEHAGACTDFAGHPHIRTPNLDRLAAGGMVCDQAYCNSPLCVPSRMSFMTGKEVHRLGIWDNGIPLASDAVTWAHLLRAHGYETVLAGKMHFIGPDQLHGFERRLSADLYLPLIQTWQWDTAEIRPELKSLERLKQAGPGRGANVNYDDQVLDAATAYLQEWADGSRDRPFALCASFILPHFPLKVPQEYFDLYYPDNVDMPVLPPGYLDRLHPVYQRLRQYFALERCTDEETRRGRAAYYGLITYLDSLIGRLLAQLDALGLTEDTLVVYVSDHGEMMGEHGLWWKCTFYEPSVRVPLVFSWPSRIQPGRFQQSLGLVDLVPTMLDLLDAPRPDDLDGDSFARILRGEPLHWKDIALSEYHAHGAMTCMRMVRSGRWKLSYFADAPPLLHDLESDPGEFVDRSDDPACTAILAELTRRALADWEPEALLQAVLHSQRSRKWIEQAEVRSRQGTRQVPWQ